MKQSNNENALVRILGRIGDYFALSFCWLLCCIPLITIGSATIALFDAAACCLPEKGYLAVRHFFGTFKKRLLRGVLLTILWLGVSYFLLISYQILCQLAQSGGIWIVMRPVFLVTLLVPLAVLCWLVPLQGRTALGFFAVHKTALSYAISYLPQTLAACAVLIAGLLILRYVPILILLLPGAIAHLQSVILEAYLPDEA